MPINCDCCQSDIIDIDLTAWCHDSCDYCLWPTTLKSSIFWSLFKLRSELAPAKIIFVLICNLLAYSYYTPWICLFQSARIDGIRQMDPPITGAQLQQFIWLMLWMSSAITRFSDLLRPLYSFFAKVLEIPGRPSNSALSIVHLSHIGWDL